MRLVATSDLHGNLPVMPECDVLVIAGDVCPHFDHDLAFQKSWLTTNFAEWLREQPADCIIGIAGNHDKAFVRWPELGYELPWHYLCDSGFTYKGMWFHGTPWTYSEFPLDSPWVFHQNHDGMVDRTSRIPQYTDVIVSHGPPYKLCDLTNEKFGSMHAGWPGWKSIFDTVEPDLFVCGHIHSGYGWNRVTHPLGNSTTVANVALTLDPPNYSPVQPPVLFEINRKEITIPSAKAFYERTT